MGYQHVDVLYISRSPWAPDISLPVSEFTSATLAEKVDCTVSRKIATQIENSQTVFVVVLTKRWPLKQWIWCFGIPLVAAPLEVRGSQGRVYLYLFFTHCQSCLAGFRCRASLLASFIREFFWSWSCFLDSKTQVSHKNGSKKFYIATVLRCFT